MIPFEKPLLDLERRIDELRRTASSQLINVDVELADLESKSEIIRHKIFSNLTPYESTQIARHPRRPSTLELIGAMTTGFIELHGDRNFLDDKSIVGGLARMDNLPIVIIGHQKGRGTKDNIFRNGLKLAVSFLR